MIKNKINTLLAALCLLALSLPSPILGNDVHYTLRHYSVADGLPQSTIMCIIQDRDDLIWIGTWNGLCRFDGYEFRTYKPAAPGENAGSNRIDKLYEDSLGYIYLQANDGALYRFDKSTETFLQTGITDTQFSLRANGKWLLCEDKKGSVWVAGDNQTLHIEQTEHKPAQLKEFALHGVAEFITSTETGVCIGTNSGIEFFFDNKQQSVTPSQQHQENNFTAATASGNKLWLATATGGLFRQGNKARKLEKSDLNLKSSINDIIAFKDHLIAIATECEGLVIYDADRGTTQKYDSHNNASITSNRFTNLYLDHNGNLWTINEQNGVWRYDCNTNRLKHYLARQDIRYENLLQGNFFALEDNEGKVWLNPQGGGFSYYSEEEDRLISLPTLTTNMLHCAFFDKAGSLWLGTYDLGLDRMEINYDKFTLSEYADNDLSKSEVRAICQTNQNDIYLALKNGQIVVCDSNLSLKRIETTGTRIYSFLQTNNSLLFGTKGDGLIIKTGGTTHKYQMQANAPYSLNNNNIYDMLAVGDSTIYIATYGGGVNIMKGDKFIHTDNDWTNYPDNFASKARQLTLINDTTVWVATTNGLLIINTLTLTTQVHPYADIRCIVLTQDGKAWLGTFGEGLIEILNVNESNLFDEKNIKIHNHSNDLISDIVTAIAIDNNDNLWFTYEGGISHYDREKNIFLHFNPLNGDQQANFGEAKPILTHNGHIIFGYNKGYCTFSPTEITYSDDRPKIILTDYLYSDRIEYPNSHNYFSIDYAAVNFAGAENILYAYKLDGIDAQWNYVGHQRKATYNNLRPGTYTFSVQSTNANGIWCDNARTITIVIKAPFWTSNWAIFLYLIIIAAVIFLVYRNVTTNNKLRQEIEVEQKVSDIKLRFFTNISHELRTPLTLISGPVDNILQTENISDSVRQQLEIVESNASRMLRLINQILDFRKIQNNKMRLSVRETDLTELAHKVFLNFTKEADDKHIRFYFEDDAPNTIVWVDRDKVDIIIYNLLSNAFKFTPAAGKVTLRLAQKNNFAIIQVSDTGIGIPKEQRSILFERFSSHNEINNSAEKTGSGIGLNLVKELVNMHHGFIEVESEVGKGTTFTVMLLHGKEHYGMEADIITTMPELSSDIEYGFIPDENNIFTFDPEKRIVLVVDDNKDMCRYLLSILSREYNVITAENGKEAIDIASRRHFDLVITDLMMPEMDGLELTNYLKTNESTSHLPVILLTAKSAIESRLEAMKYGADDYITKPFSAQYLIARVDNMLRQRDRLQETYRAMIMTTDDEQGTGNRTLTPDEQFLHHLHKFILKNLDNNNLTVDDVVREMTLGRTVFFNKLKSLTGLSPVEYIRDLRLRHAAKLLLNERYNITEITYMIGMNDSRYFAKCFKTEYGMTPTEYRKNHLHKKL